MNPAGKERRSSCKNLILGLMYGRGVASIAEQIKSHDGPTTQEDIKRAQDITDKFFANYPKAKEWIDKTQNDAKVNGYVEDLWGRRRRLPDIQLPKYVIVDKSNSTTFNPLLGATGKFSNQNIILVEKYRKAAYNSKSRKELEKLRADAEKDNISIVDNSGFISQAERQCVNARIQGGAATMTKRALYLLYSDLEMRKLGYRTLFPVHDEIIGECPAENAERVKERLSELMMQAAKPECIVPMKCDADSFTSWYFDVYSSKLRDTFEKLSAKCNSKEEALSKLYDDHCECTKEQIDAILEDLI